MAALTRSYMETGMDADAATAATVARLEGAFALGFLFDGEEDLMIVARKGSPSPSGMATARCSWGPTPSPSPP